MSATITWRPVKPGKTLPVNAPSSFKEIMIEAFGEPPWNLNNSHALILHGIRAANKNEHETIDEITEAIAKHGEIIVEVSY